MINKTQITEEEKMDRELSEMRKRIKGSLEITLNSPTEYLDNLYNACHRVKGSFCIDATPFWAHDYGLRVEEIGAVGEIYISEFKEYYERTGDRRAAILASRTLNLLLRNFRSLNLTMELWGLSREEQEKIKEEGIRCELDGAP